MSNTILIKRSGTANSVPGSGSLALGELAINYQDGNLFYKDSGGTVQTIASKQFVSVSGNITGANVNAVGLSLSGNVLSAINSTSNITTTGNVSGDYILGNGYFLTGVITSVANINLGNSNVTVVSPGGNITVGIGGTSNVVVFASTGEYVTGLISATGNITGGNISGTNITGSLTTPAQGNITSVGVLSGLTVAATVFADGYSARSGSDLPIQVLGANANILIQPNGTGITDFNAKPIANISTVSATGNITGGNVTTGGILSVTGNANVTANVQGGNIKTGVS